MNFICLKGWLIKMKKKIKLRKWVEVVLCCIMIVSGIILVSECESLKIAILKSVICLPIIFIISWCLSVYGGLNE